MRAYHENCGEDPQEVRMNAVPPEKRVKSTEFSRLQASIDEHHLRALARGALMQMNPRTAETIVAHQHYVEEIGFITRQEAQLRYPEEVPEPSAEDQSETEEPVELAAA